MRDNDISNRAAARCAIVFEGALGFLPKDKEREFGKLMEKGRWSDAVGLWEVNDYLARIIWDRVWRMDMNIDVVTFLGPDGFAEALAERLGSEDLPVNEVWATTPKILARKLPMMPDLIRVYDPYEQHQLYYGGKGKYLTDANQIGY